MIKAYINGFAINKKVKTITYRRQPSFSEIKFGHEAIHYRDFEIKELVKPDGNIKKWIKAVDDGLMYRYF